MPGESRWRGTGGIRTAAVRVAVLAAWVVTGCGDPDSPAAPESVPAAELAAGEAKVAERELAAVIGAFVGESELTAEQAREISALTASAPLTREPRERWRLAAELAGILTDEQVLSIEKSMETAREIRRSQFRAEPRMEEREARRDERRALEHAAMAEVLELTEAQSEALRAFAAERPDSAAGPEWRESRRTAIASILTDEQRQIVTLHRLVVGHRTRTAAGAGRRLRPGARVHGGWGS